MKNSSLTTKMIMVLLFLSVVAYFGFQSWNYFTSPEITTAVYTYRAEHTLALNGLLVRDEAVIDCTDTLVELVRAEGERVAKGKRVATVYQNPQALAAEQEAASLREQLEQLRYAQTAARDTEAALRLDSDIEEDMIAVRASLVRGNYAALDGNAATLKSTVLRREYAYRGTTDLSERIAAMEARLRDAVNAVGGGSRAVTAPFAGTYSSVADGYENVLTPEMLPSLTPSEFQAIVPESVSSTVGKLVRGDKWYYAAVVTQEESARLVKGKRYELAISGVDMSLPVTLSNIGRPENERCLVVFSGDQYLSYVTMLRDQSAELILQSFTGLRTPKNALRINDGQNGVYCRIGRQAWFKPVKVLYQGEDYCLLAPDQIDAVRESDLVFYTLRPGDEVIVTAGNLYNGKVIE